MFIIIETHGGPEYARVVTDGNGYNVVFDTKPEAEAYALENCQRGVVLDYAWLGD